MGKKKTISKSERQAIKAPSKVAVAARQASGSGVHGGTPAQNNKRARSATKSQLKQLKDTRDFD